MTSADLRAELDRIVGEQASENRELGRIAQLVGFGDLRQRIGVPYLP